MANAPIESGIGNVWLAKQTGLGVIATPNATSTIKPRWQAGFLKPNKTLGQEEYLDGNAFSSPAEYVDNVAGEVGSITIQGQPETVGPFFAWILAIDVVTGAGDPWTHTMTSSGATGDYITCRQKAGSAVGPIRQGYWDAKIAKLMFESGQDQKTAHLTADIQSLKAGEAFGTDPVAAEATTDPYYWPEVVGAVKIDTVVTNECHGETLDIDRKTTPYKGDAVAPIAIVDGKGEINRTIKVIITDDLLATYYNMLYGAPGAPASGVGPVATVYYANIDTKYTKVIASRTMQITTPRVACNPADLPFPVAVEGGVIEAIIGGVCLKSGATPALTIVILSGDSASYA